MSLKCGFRSARRPITNSYSCLLVTTIILESILELVFLLWRLCLEKEILDLGDLSLMPFLLRSYNYTCLQASTEVVLLNKAAQYPSTPETGRAMEPFKPMAWRSAAERRAVLLGEGASEGVGEQFPRGLFPKKIQGDADSVRIPRCCCAGLGCTINVMLF